MALVHSAPRLRGDTIDRIRGVFGLSTQEVAALFGVSRPAVQQWHAHGFPIAHAADVDRVRELADVFAREFVPARVPQIVRTPGKGLGPAISPSCPLLTSSAFGAMQ